MIVVIGRVKTDAERRERLIDLGRRVAQASREEGGCARVADSRDLTDVSRR